MNFIRSLGATALLLASVAAAPSFAATVDVIQTPTAFFVPNDALKEVSPWYRDRNQDWGWQHNAIAGTITTASLDISAYDVDFASGERNEIFLKDEGDWVSIGFLAGSDDSWNFSTFNLTSNFFNEVSTGLEVFMDINTDPSSGDWYVALSKSVLSVPAGGPRPDPAPVPEPSAWAMLIAGFGLVGAMARRRRSVVAA